MGQGLALRLGLGLGLGLGAGVRVLPVCLGQIDRRQAGAGLAVVVVRG